jgi:hypothetical protein
MENFPFPTQTEKCAPRLFLIEWLQVSDGMDGICFFIDNLHLRLKSYMEDKNAKFLSEETRISRNSKSVFTFAFRGWKMRIKIPQYPILHHTQDKGLFLCNRLTAFSGQVVDFFSKGEMRLFCRQLLF